jgi:hypothetical protein
MKKKKSISVSNYTQGTLMSGIVIGSLEKSAGTGTNMSADYMNAASKPIIPLTKIKGTTMVFKGLKKLKSPLKIKGAKRL